MISQRIMMSQSVAKVFEGFDIPPRPKLTIGGQEPYRGYGPFHGFDTRAPRIFRLTWTLQSEVQHADIQRYEVLACIQRVRSSEISRWRKVADIVPTGKDRTSADGKQAVSRRMTGFDAGFRYQLVVRGVDVLGREGPFSKPVFVVI